MPADAAAAIDLGHLSAQCLGDGALQSELLGLFTRQAREIVEALGAETRTPPPGLCASDGLTQHRAVRLLHTLCGSARAVGAWQVANEAEHLERALRDGLMPAPSRQQLDGLGQSVRRACAAAAVLSQRTTG